LIAGCFFPESELRPFFYDVDGDVRAGTVIAESVVNPPDAEILLASVRAKIPLGVSLFYIFFKFSSNEWRFALIYVSPVTFSGVDSVQVFVTVVCNGEAFPLFSLIIRTRMITSPQFYNEPYHLEVNEVTSILNTPVVVIDWDSELTPPKMYIEVLIDNEIQSFWRKNRKRFQWTKIDILNPDGTFEIHQDSGNVYIRDNRFMDRELLANLDLVAKIRVGFTAAHSTHFIMMSLFILGSKSDGIRFAKPADETSDGQRELLANIVLLQAQSVVTVHLDAQKDITDASPRFERSRYVFRTPENLPPAVIGVVRAYHVALSSRNFSLRYEMISNKGPKVPFRLHPVSGEIATESALDHESKQNYELKIRACLSVNPNSCGYTSVVVIVVDVNDNAPRFSSPQFQISLPSDLAANSEVITLLATDSDSGPNGEIDYFINPPNAVFVIGRRSGVVQTISALTEPRYDLVVEAGDHGVPQLHGSTRLTISVHGTNPSAPVFDQKRYEIILNSPVRAGSVVTELHAKDPDPGPEGQIIYRLEFSPGGQNYSSKFSINEQTGVISAIQRITSEDGPFDFLVVAEDQSTVFKRKVDDIELAIMVGDSSLRFLPLPSTIYISAEKAVGSVVLRASAYTSSSIPVHFRVLENDRQFIMDGDLLRVATHLLPGETHLTVRGETENVHSDHRLRIVVMSDRDKYPVFPQLIYDIDSRFPLVVHRFDARVLNGTVRYRFFPDGNAPEGLHLDPNTVCWSYHIYLTYTPFEFLSSNMEAVTKVQLKVKDVNEYVPKFERKLYEVRIGEDIAAGSPIVRLNATDLDKTDGSHLLYKVVGGSGRNLVFVQEDGTLILSDALLGGEIPMSFTVVVEAIDKGGKRVSRTKHVVLTDVNDNRPVFASPSLTWNVTEGSFALLRIISPLDYEAKPFFNLVIEAADRGNPPQMSTASVTVNVINLAAFANTELQLYCRAFQVSADLPIGQPLLTLAVNDADHDRLSFLLSGDAACSSLTVNPLGVVAFSIPVSKRKTGMINCVVSATDGVHVSNATTSSFVLDIVNGNFEKKVIFRKSLEQNHSPRFAKELYTFVLNSSQNGELLEKVTAVDQDGDVIRYFIEPPELRNLFAIDAEGQLSVRVPVFALKQALYSFLVISEDNGKPVMSSFTNIRVLIPENDVLGTRNLLEDTSSTMTSAGDGSFQNNTESSGVLLTSVPFVVYITATSDSSDLSSTVTSLEQSFYTKDTTFSTLSTTAISFETDTATVTTTADVSYSQSSTANEAFGFSQSIYFAFVPEGEYTNGIRVALKPEALSVNKNTSVKFEISDNVRNMPFFLTADGQLIVFDVDRESRAAYSFPIKAQALLNVTVLDINDNYPLFDPAPSIIGVFRDIAIGVPLHRFTARDLDTDNYGNVVILSISPQTAMDAYFTGGILFVSGSLKSTSDDEFAITVFARDGGRPSLKSTQKVSTISDLLRLLFSCSASIKYSRAILKTIFILHEKNLIALPTVFISRNTFPFSGLFKIEDGGRVILNRVPTNSEKNRYFQLNITAENSYGTGSMDVFIESQTSSTTQERSSTSSCYFPTKVYNTEILENRDGRNRIAKVTSTCEKNGQPFQYSFSKPTGLCSFMHFLPIKKIFAFYQELMNRIFIASPEVYFPEAKKKLTKFETLVVVRVLDENDNAPVFVRLNSDHSVTGVVLWQAHLNPYLQAKDNDEQPQLSYSLSGGDAEYFFVNATTGVVVLAKTIADYTKNLLTCTATVTDGIHRSDVQVVKNSSVENVGMESVVLCSLHHILASAKSSPSPSFPPTQL
uniref:Cadherin domain protein n=1 Tax=Angiostrongylus costaricensis TaxID=334426 RepID=A0A158PKA6_ANGCS